MFRFIVCYRGHLLLDDHATGSIRRRKSAGFGGQERRRRLAEADLEILAYANAGQCDFVAVMQEFALRSVRQMERFRPAPC